MIGPSSEGILAKNQELSKVEEELTTGKKRLFDELYEENFESIECENAGKRYLQEVSEPIEFVSANEVIDESTHLFSPISSQGITDNCQVARLEVLLVDGTSCTWTTLSELEEQNFSTTTTPSYECSSVSSDSPSSLSSYSCGQSKDIQQEEIHIIHEMNYQSGGNYWNPTKIDSLTSTPNSTRRQEFNPSLIINQQQQFDDQETGNLSWLLDFKLDPFIEAADDRASIGPIKTTYNKSKITARTYSTPTYTNQDYKKNYTTNNNNHEVPSFPIQSSPTNYKTDDRHTNTIHPVSPKKPPFTYTELIEHALQEKGELTVSAIYQWISERYPYYKSNDDRWKNSVRHNLSINPHFRKGSKAPHGAGHLWAIANRSEMRPRPFLASTNSSNSISRTTKFLADDSKPRNADHTQMSAADEVEMATASIMQQPSEDQIDLTNSSVTLEHCAGQILSGVKKQVEVQYLVPMTIANSHEQAAQSQTELHYPVKESDFLNPVSKEVLAEECGLISEGYLVTELNPASLGLNLVDQELISPENLFGEELNFQFYELASPSQIQSA